MAFLNEGWYCAGFSADINGTPVGRHFLNKHIVLYRQASSGKPVALDGRCPHRFAPLAQGRVRGDELECPYHGLRFNANGRCSLNPHGGHIPASAQVKSYAVEERDGVIWVWMGDADKADLSKIIDTRLYNDPQAYTTVTGHMLVNAHYQLVIDNLLDLTHAAYIHVNTLGAPPEEMLAPDRFEFKFHEAPEYIESNYVFRSLPTPPQIKPFWPADSGDAGGNMRWYMPSNLSLGVSMADPANPEAAPYLQPSLHLLVPQDDSHTHYFFAVARNRHLDSPSHSELLERDMRRAFEQEDEPMIRACQSLMGTSSLFDCKPVLLPTDVAAVRARRLLDQAIAHESAARGTAT